MGLVSIAEDMITRWGTTVDLLVNVHVGDDEMGNFTFDTNTYPGIPAYVGSFILSDSDKYPFANAQIEVEDIHVLLSRSTPIHPDSAMRIYYANRYYRIVSVRPVYARMGQLLYFDIHAKEDLRG